MAIYRQDGKILSTKLPPNKHLIRNPDSSNRVLRRCSAQTSRLLDLVGAGTVAIAFLCASMVRPAIAEPPSLANELVSHFRCYSVVQSEPPILGSVILMDQFDDKANHLENDETYWVGQAIGFCPPVDKTTFGPGGQEVLTEKLDRDHHLAMYEIHQARPRLPLNWKVAVENQFGRQTLFANKPVLLGVPTWKTMFEGQETDHGEPEGLNHYKCYRAKGESLNVLAILQDEEFEATKVFVREPVLFCNPTEKLEAGSTQTHRLLAEIENEDAHLTCYNIVGAEQVGISALYLVSVDNQFNHVIDPWSVVTDERLLCVPSFKRSVIGTPGSITSGPPSPRN